MELKRIFFGRWDSGFKVQCFHEEEFLSASMCNKIKFDCKVPVLFKSKLNIVAVRKI